MESTEYKLGFQIGYAMAQRESGQKTLADSLKVYDNGKPIIKGMIDGGKQAKIDKFRKENN